MRSDFEGMQPTFKQVPPRVPRFSMQVTFTRTLGVSSDPSQHSHETRARDNESTYLEALLTGLDGSNVAGNTTSNDDEVLLI